jgi:hypothetical protein
MLVNYRVATQLVVSQVVLSSIELDVFTSFHLCFLCMNFDIILMGDAELTFKKYTLSSVNVGGYDI